MVLCDLPRWEALTPLLGPSPSAYTATLLVVWNINVSICSVFQSIRSCRSLAARNETLLKLGCTYIAWHWVLCAIWRRMKLIQRLSEREEECLPEILLSQGSFYRIFSIFFHCVWYYFPYHKTKVTPNVREGGTEGVEKDHAKSLLIMENLSNKP